MYTESRISAMSFDKVKQLKLLEGCNVLKTNLKLKAYDGTIITPVEVLPLRVKYKNLCKT